MTHKPTTRWILFFLIAILSFGVDVLLLATTSRAPQSFDFDGLVYRIQRQDADITTLSRSDGETLTLVTDAEGILTEMSSIDGTLTYDVDEETGIGLFTLYDGSSYDESWFESAPDEVELYYEARIFLNTQPTAGGLIGTLLICLALSALGAWLVVSARSVWFRLRGAFCDQVIQSEVQIIRATGVLLLIGAGFAAILS